MVKGIDAELCRSLAPVAAPEDLWGRIQSPACAQPGEPLRWQLWAFAAVLAAAIAIFCFNLRSDTTSYIAGVAASQLTNGQVDFRSADPVEIRAWIKANAGFDVPLPAQHSAELAGVSLIRGLACVSYRIGNHEARLIVAPGGAAPPHHSMQSVVYAGAALSSWAMQGQTYALAAASQDLRAACVLCHAEGPARPRG